MDLITALAQIFGGFFDTRIYPEVYQQLIKDKLVNKQPTTIAKACHMKRAGFVTLDEAVDSISAAAADSNSCPLFDFPVYGDQSDITAWWQLTKHLLTMFSPTETLAILRSPYPTAVYSLNSHKLRRGSILVSQAWNFWCSTYGGHYYLTPEMLLMLKQITIERQGIKILS